MPRSYKLYLNDILNSSEKILKFVSNDTLELILRDEMRLDAIVRNFEIIGVASGALPAEITDKYSSVEWKKISNFRNLLAHEYFGIDNEIMWDVIKNKLPDLIKDIKEIIKSEE